MNETIYYECNEENYKFILNELHNKDKEIKRLQEELKDYELTKKEWNDLFDENIKLHHIIKEVREFIYKCNDGKQGINYSGCSELLEILERVNNDK